MAVLARRGKTKSTNANNIRLNTLHALLQSQETIEFLEKPASCYTGNALKEVFDRIAEHHDWPIRWVDITPANHGKYGASLRQWHQKLSEWNQSDAAFLELHADRQGLYLNSLATWYDAESAPNGLRFVGDNGPKIPEVYNTPSAPNPAIMLFWHLSCMIVKN
ncbi:hypothetical protein GGI35DRAFT_485566 [Trichoderma velutinum]